MSQSPVPDNRPAKDSAYLHVDGVGEYKWKWVKAANRTNPRQKLADWVITTLNQAAEEQLRPEAKPGSGGTTD